MEPKFTTTLTSLATLYTPNPVLPLTMCSYELLERLGGGGMGIVFKAWQANEKRHLAIKMIRPEMASNTVAIQRFIREGKLLLNINHPNIMPIIEIGEIDNHHFIAMPLLEGGSLEKRLNSLMPHPQRAAELFKLIALAVDHLHSKGILHRDLKPDNIMFGSNSNDTPYVSDLGLAISLEEPERFTVTGQPIGTPYYRSPEQFRGDKKLTAGTDIYSLGAILYAMLTGRPPFIARNIIELGDKVLNKAPKKPSELNSEVPGQLDDICMDCLHKDANSRYLNVRDLYDNLDRFLSYKRLRPVTPATVSYQMFKVGDIELKVRRIIGGDGKTIYRYPDGIVCQISSHRFELPPEIAAVAPVILKERQDAARARNALFENRAMVRLDDYKFGLSDDSAEVPYPLTLITSVTDYHTMQVTNSVIDQRLRTGQTIREKHTREPDDLLNSQLANPLATNLSLITTDGYIYIAKRGHKVGMNPGGWAPAVSGTGNPELDRVNNVYNPFLTAKREAGQEILGGYELDLSEITFFGLARTLGFHFPFLFGELRVNLTSKQLESQVPTDIYETSGLVARPFNIDDVTEWILELYQELDQNNQPTARAHTTIFSLLQSLRYAYPADLDWQTIVNRLTYK